MNFVQTIFICLFFLYLCIVPFWDNYLSVIIEAKNFHWSVSWGNTVNYQQFVNFSIIIEATIFPIIIEASICQLSLATICPLSLRQHFFQLSLRQQFVNYHLGKTLSMKFVNDLSVIIIRLSTVNPIWL